MNFISIKVIPNALRSEVILKNNQIIVKVHAVPEDGKANRKVVKIFKEQLDLNVEIIKGLKQREKIISCMISEDEIKKKIEEKN